jgi:uncharacterized protein (DUF1501 family)
LAYAVDFRNLYANVIEEWWGGEAVHALGGKFSLLDLVRA